jgi:hypothetical protein
MNADYLSRQPYLDLLKSIIENQKDNQTGYSFAIDGEWGSGKTWILHELEKQLLEEKDNKYLIFHYNAWENDFYDEPLVAILSVMIEKLNQVTSQKSIYDATIDELLNQASADLLTLVSGIIKEVTKIDAEKIIKRKKRFFKKIKESTKLSAKDINKLVPLQHTLQEVRNNLEKISEKFNIILAIDELDRCLPEYSIKVLERLHHICNEMPVIQIIAINKKDLSFGIAKVYGKNNSEPDTEKFADKYLQKFVKIFIPLNNGDIITDESILNGIYNDYEPGIKIDKTYLVDFYKKLMNGINPRTQELILQHVKLVHKLTILTGHELEHYSYGLLCCEFLYCLKYLIFREKSKFVLIHEESHRFTLSANITNSRCEIISPRLFESNLNNIFRNDYNCYADYIRINGINLNDKEVSGFPCENGSAQLLNYFVSNYYIATKWPEVYSMDSLINPERMFLQEFCKVLEKL